MSNHLAHNLELSIAAAERCAEQAIAFLDDDEQAQSLKKLYEITKGYCMLEERAAISVTSIREAKSMLREKQNEEMSFEHAYNSQFELREQEMKDVTTHPKYVKFDKSVKVLLAKANGDGPDEDSDSESDDDLRLTEAEVNTIDPISQQIMVSPVRNKICGHAYEKSTILQMLKTKKRMRCPYVGCPTQGLFGAGDLEDHEELKQILKRRKAN